MGRNDGNVVARRECWRQAGGGRKYQVFLACSVEEGEAGSIFRF